MREYEKSPVTVKQRAVLQFIVDGIRRTGMPPTFLEMMDHFHFTKNGAMCHLRALQGKGLIVREKGRARQIRVVGLKVVVQFADDEAGRRLAAILAEDDQLVAA